MHHPTDRIAHTTAFVTPVAEHWLEREIARRVHPMKDRSNDPSHHERTLLPRSYISLFVDSVPRINKHHKSDGLQAEDIKPHTFFRQLWYVVVSQHIEREMIMLLLQYQMKWVAFDCLFYLIISHL